MINEAALKGKWHQVSGKLKQHWDKLSDDDVRSFDGNVEQLVGRLQHRTGEARDVIEQFLGEVTDQVPPIAIGVLDTAQAASAKFTKVVDESNEVIRDGFEEVQAFVKERPVPSVAVAFGLGVASGMVAALLLYQSRRKSQSSQACSAAEKLGTHILSGLTEIVPGSIRKHVQR